MPLVLAGDIGGTNTRLALFDERYEAKALRVFPSREHAGLVEIVRAFVAETGARPEAASFGIAGPVKDGACKATNLPWTVDSRNLARELALRHAGLLNDLEANAWGIPTLPQWDVVTLHPGTPGQEGNAALIAAGTGLGEAGLYWDGSSHHPFATEGGHAAFSPRSELEDALLEHLRKQHGHVSWERVLSGPGLVNVYTFLRDMGRAPEEPEVAEAMRQGDPAAAISQAALAGKSELCRAALDLFASLYGAEAGNLALKTLALSGVWVGGGIAPRILPILRAGGFAEAYTSQGRMSELVASMPVRVITNDKTALRGAARHALLTLR